MASRKDITPHITVEFAGDQLLNIHALADLFERPENWIKRNLPAPFVKLGEERCYFLSDVHAFLRSQVCPGKDGGPESTASPDQDDPAGSSAGETDGETE